MKHARRGEAIHRVERQHKCAVSHSDSIGDLISQPCPSYVTHRFFVFEEEVIYSSKNQAEMGRGGRTLKVGASTGALLCFVTFHTSFHDTGTIVFSKVRRLFVSVYFFSRKQDRRVQEVTALLGLVAFFLHGS